MAEEHPRWGDAGMAPRVVYSPKTYDSKAKGPVRRAELHDADGLLLGRVWTDDQNAAGYLPDEAAGPAGRRAGSAVWAIHRDAYNKTPKRVPASDLLDPALYESVGTLGEPSDD
ncbi:MAG: hypothetical protein ABR585_07720 [Gemmatimonadaceae bacterium]